MPPLASNLWDWRLRPCTEQLLSHVPGLILQGALAAKKLSRVEARVQPLWHQEHAALRWDLTSHGAAHHSVPWGDSAHSTPDIWVNECFSAKGQSDQACMAFAIEHETGKFMASACHSVITWYILVAIIIIIIVVVVLTFLYSPYCSLMLYLLFMGFLFMICPSTRR